MEKITYIFYQGRKEKIENKTYQALDHYYLVNSFISEGYSVEIIELNQKPKKINRIFYFYDKILNKFLSLPSYSHMVCNLENYKILKNSDRVFIVNESVGFSVLPILILLKIFTKKQVNFFVMGLFSKKIKFNSLSFFHNSFIRLLVFCVDNLFFLGKGEFDRANILMSNNIKFHFTGFSIDTNFWKASGDVVKKSNQILFVGNDGNRNIDLLTNLADKMKQFNFLVISNLLEDNQKKQNLKILKGQWNSNEITDVDLRRHYEESLITIIPLKNSYQPSGQSVALQSMSLGIPVLISKTNGFWDPDSFTNNEHLIIVKNENIDEWENKIIETVSNKELMDSISKKALEKINVEHNLKDYFYKIKEIINI
tara:strand:+ start:1108 stop:2214 length:1107 start_codon:yes stop_codon:yes gene_type:complete